MNITKIYLVENCYGDPNKIYVGKTKGSREKNHKKTYGSQIFYTYIDEVEGYKKEDWKPLECFWIEQFRQWGFELMNKNEGGGGPEFLSQETKDKMSKTSKGKPKLKLHGIKRSEETKNKMREIQLKNKYNLGKKRSEETKQKQRIAKIGTKQSKETIEKRTNKMKGVPKPKGFGENHSKLLKGISKPKDFGKKLSQIKTGIPLPSGTGEKIGKTKEKPVIQFSKLGELINIFDSAKKAAEYIGVHEVTMRLHLGGKYKTCKKFIFKYKDNG